MPTQELPTMIDETTFEATLMRYRGGIDAIDKQILSLLQERISIVKQVGELKKTHGVTGSYIRPGREAMMVRALLDKAQHSDFPKEAIIAIWRIIIGASTFVESPLNTLTLDGDHAGHHHASHYFGAHIPHKTLPWQELRATIAADRHAVAVLPLDQKAHWWHDMPPNIYVFACLPFIGETPSHVALGYVTPEPTGHDVSCLLQHDGLVLQDGFVKESDHFMGAFARPVTCKGHTA